MTESLYRKLVLSFYSELRYPIDLEIYDLIQRVTIKLFIDRDSDSVLAIETRKQLIMLRDYNSLSFFEETLDS